MEEKVKKKSIAFLILLATTLFLNVGCNNAVNLDDDGTLDEYGLTASERKALEGEDLDRLNEIGSREFVLPTETASSFIYKILRGNKNYVRSVNRGRVSGSYIAMVGQGSGSDKAVSTNEANGYGMRLAIYGWKGVRVTSAGAARYRQKYKDIFDNIWRLQHSFLSKEKTGLHSWIIPNDFDISKSSTTATDGELDIAYALLQADKLWGSNGSINYKAEAKIIINAIAEHLIETKSLKGKEYTYLLIGDWCKSNSNGSSYYSRPCDWMIHHFRTFIRFLESEGQGNSDTVGRYRNLIKTAEEVIDRNIWGSGLMPDFIRFSSFTPGHVKAADPGDDFIKSLKEKTPSDHYAWNSCRIPWRLAMDLRQEGRSTAYTAAKALRRIYNTTLKGKWVFETGSDYYLNGVTANSEYESAFGSPFAASMIGRMSFINSPGEGQYLSNILIKQKDFISTQFLGDPQYGYFGDCITAFCLVILENDKRVISAPY